MFFEWAFLSCLVNIQLFRNFGFFLLWIWIFQFGKQQKAGTRLEKKLRIMGKFRISSFFFPFFLPSCVER